MPVLTCETLIEPKVRGAENRKIRCCTKRARWVLVDEGRTITPLEHLCEIHKRMLEARGIVWSRRFIRIE